MNNDKIETMSEGQNTTNDNLNLSLTIDSEKGVNLFKKTEKIVKGLHLATQHISDNSSLRRYIRENSIGLIECVSEFTLQSVDISEVIEQKLSLSKSANPIKYLTYKRSELNRRIQVTMSYVDLAVSTGYMSYKNASILSDNIVSYKNEMNVFLDSIESYLVNISHQLADSLSTASDYQKDIETRYPQGQVSGGQNPIELELSDSFFEISETQVQLKFVSDNRGYPETNRSENHIQGQTSGHDLGHTNRDSIQKIQDTSHTTPAVKDFGPKGGQVSGIRDQFVDKQKADTSQLQPRKTIVQKFSGSRDDLHTFLNSMGSHPANISSNNSSPTMGQPIKNDRQVTIINTIKEKGELSIKDLTDVIKGCSEKTIQRELISLVTDGVLYKTGERRWSRYSLAA
jgi:hypothetical protein